MLLLNKVFSINVVTRRELFSFGAATTANVFIETSNAKSGDGARIALPSKDEADAIMGSRADSYGDSSRENSIYKQQQAKIQSDSLLSSKLSSLKTTANKLQAKLSPAVEKQQNPKILDALNADMYQFKSLLSDVTKLRQGGKVCLIDISQRGGFIPKGLDPDDCPLQLIQVAVIQDANDLTRAAQTRDNKAASKAYAAFVADFDRFLAGI